MAKATNIAQWSFSRWSVYDTCPFQARCKFIDKLPEPEKNWAADRGTILHKKAEHYVKGDIRGLPKELKIFGSEIKELKKMCATTEEDLAVTRNWSPTTYDDWNNVWCRCNADVTVDQDEESTVIDYKTGKIYEDKHKEQGELMALLKMCHAPKIETVDVEFWYFDQDDVLNWEYSREGDFDKLKTKWEKRATKMSRDKKFIATPAKPGQPYCNWCNFGKSKGGPCKHG